MRNGLHIQSQLLRLGLSPDEATIFVHLLDGPKNQLQLSRATGIARSNVYRITDVLADKGLLTQQMTDSGKLLVSAQVEALERLVAEQELQAQQQRSVLAQLLPTISNLQQQTEASAIKTYNGATGIKQMLWNELKAEGDILLFSSQPLAVATGQHWANKFYREMGIRGVHIRSIENQPTQSTAVAGTQRTNHCTVRYIPTAQLAIHFEMSVYNNRIAFYSPFDQDARLGTEVENKFLAQFMQQVFEYYWSIATPSR